MLKNLFARVQHWLYPERRAARRLPAVLARFHDPRADPLHLARELVDCIRPQQRGDHSALDRYQTMLHTLEADAALRLAFRQRLLALFASRQLLTFFTDSGILPDSGFFSEWLRILGHRLLPARADTHRLNDCLRLIYHHPNDWRWLEAVPPELADRFWAILAGPGAPAEVDWRGIHTQLLDAVLLLAHRISGLGVDSELMRATPDLERHIPRFTALSAEALAWARCYRQQDAAGLADAQAQLMVMVAQCEDTLERIRKRARSHGASLRLIYQLTRGQQSLERLRELVAVLTADLDPARRDDARQFRARFTRNAFIAENRRNSLRHYLQQLSALLAMRVTSHAAETGEHYICANRDEYRQMWRSAGGAGVLIGLMALLKIGAAGLHAPLFVEALLYSLIYGLGFVLIYLLGLTVATKQPAMTAQTLAAQLAELRPNRQAEVERLVDVAAAVSRSQLAAILGNVLVAAPMALLLSALFTAWRGAPPVDMAKAQHLLADLDPLSWALPHAAIAGFYLFLSGLITGFFANQAAYDDIGARLAQHPGLNRLLGARRAARVGQYVQAHLGGIMGNFLFGCMLGSTGVVGAILGLPLDIRHIAFSSANLGYALAGLEFQLGAAQIAWAVFGVLAIGAVNLAVSFALALRTALRARDAQIGDVWPILRALGHRLRRQPRQFVLPPRH